MPRPRRRAACKLDPGRAVQIVRAAALGALALLSGCLPPQASYSLGLGTSEIRGSVELPGESPIGGPTLVIAYKHHHKFTGLDNEPAFTHPSAHVTKAGTAGQFSISVPADVVRVDLIFAAPGRLTDVFRFRRQLGIGTVTYRARMAPIADWRDHFYTYLEPELRHLIADTRYGLSPRDVETLADWLASQKSYLEAPSATEKPPPEAFPPQRR